MITPVDIQNKEFARKIKGYDCDEVDDFLDEIIHDYDMVLKDNRALKNKIGLLTKTIDNYKAVEESMTKSVEIAKETAKDIKDNANAEAQMIINNAKLDASRLAKQIDDEHIKRHREMLKVKAETDMFKSRIKTMCENIINMMSDTDE